MLRRLLGLFIDIEAFVYDDPPDGQRGRATLCAPLWPSDFGLI
jgi:hypothetical protein